MRYEFQEHHLFKSLLKRAKIAIARGQYAQAAQWHREASESLLYLADKAIAGHEYAKGAGLFYKAMLLGNAYAAEVFNGEHPVRVNNNHAIERVSEHASAGEVLAAALQSMMGFGLPKMDREAAIEQLRPWVDKHPDLNTVSEAEKREAACIYHVLGWLKNKKVENYFPGAQYYDKAAKAGHAVAMYELGVIYQEASGILRNYPKARECFLSAAKLGHAESMYNLGILYHKGLGLDQPERQQGINWLSQAAESGHTKAMIWLASIYKVEQKFGQAIELLQKAAALGEGEAMFKLAEFYRDGLGVPGGRCYHNQFRAVYWFNKGSQDEYMARLYWDNASNNISQQFKHFVNFLLLTSECREWEEMAETGFPALLHAIFQSGDDELVIAVQEQLVREIQDDYFSIAGKDFRHYLINIFESAEKNPSTDSPYAKILTAISKERAKQKLMRASGRVGGIFSGSQSEPGSVLVEGARTSI